ncbi:MAG TPA: radical SAM protein [Gemmatimonadaceae bacterium]|nr:radical SAM protein [Gemmatimonadaceae bacterium]
MDTAEKIDILMSLAFDDREGMPGQDAVALPPRLRNASAAGVLRPLNIRNVRIGANGPRTRLLRILMTNACSFNCHYCPMRRDRDLPRTLLKPAEMVRIFFAAVDRGWCSGLFITTGIPGRPTKVMDDLIEVLELLREKHGYRGYIHTKVVPGADDAQLARITQLATRVSINIETPCGETLTAIAPEKKLETTLVTLQRARTRVVASQMYERDGRPRDTLHPGGVAGMTMQFVVGATPDTDQTIISKASELYRGGGIHHAHFSAFRPIRDTPMENVRATPALREHRLYQADHLVRKYGFAHNEIVYEATGNLPLSHDPKVAWALAHPELFPVDIKRATRSMLLRIPGVGPVAARRIVNERNSAVIRDLGDVRKLGVVTTRAAGFLSIGGRRLRAERWAEQLKLWSPEEDVGAFAGTYEFSPGTFR